MNELNQSQLKHQEQNTLYTRINSLDEENKNLIKQNEELSLDKSKLIEDGLQKCNVIDQLRQQLNLQQQKYVELKDKVKCQYDLQSMNADKTKQELVYVKEQSAQYKKQLESLRQEYDQKMSENISQLNSTKQNALQYQQQQKINFDEQITNFKQTIEKLQAQLLPLQQQNFDLKENIMELKAKNLSMSQIQSNLKQNYSKSISELALEKQTTLTKYSQLENEFMKSQKRLELLNPAKECKCPLYRDMINELTVKVNNLEEKLQQKQIFITNQAKKIEELENQVKNLQLDLIKEQNSKRISNGSVDVGKVMSQLESQIQALKLQRKESIPDVLLRTPQAPQSAQLKCRKMGEGDYFEAYFNKQKQERKQMKEFEKQALNAIRKMNQQ